MPCAMALAWRTWNCAPPVKTSSMASALAESPIPPPQGTSVAAGLNKVVGEASHYLLRASHHRHERFVVETTELCKRGMDIAYDGTWDYHPLLLTLANSHEVLG